MNRSSHHFLPSTSEKNLFILQGLEKMLHVETLHLYFFTISTHKISCSSRKKKRQKTKEKQEKLAVPLSCPIVFGKNAF